MRDAGQLESALFRPQSGYYSDIITQAAALWESLSQNHPFVDDNKRTVFASMYTFLAINNVELQAYEEDVWQFLSPLYQSSSLSFEELEQWLRKNTLNHS